MPIFLHMSAVVSTNHNRIVSIKLQAIIFQNVSAKRISAQSVCQGLRPAHYMSSWKQERATLTVLVSIFIYLFLFLFGKKVCTRLFLQIKYAKKITGAEYETFSQAYVFSSERERKTICLASKKA